MGGKGLHIGATLYIIALSDGKEGNAVKRYCQVYPVLESPNVMIPQVKKYLKKQKYENRGKGPEVVFARKATRFMRLCYTDSHLELFEWVDELTTLTREGQRQFLLNAVRLLRESYMIHAGLGSISYLWGEEAAFCKKFAPYIGNQNIEFLVSEIETAMMQIGQNGSPRIVFTHFALNISKVINKL
jgi:hypothetical protein